MLEPTAAWTGSHSANDFADYFTDKVGGIRATTADAPPPTIHTRSVPPLNGFDGPALEEVTKAIQKAPCKQCNDVAGEEVCRPTWPDYHSHDWIIISARLLSSLT